MIEVDEEMIEPVAHFAGAIDHDSVMTRSLREFLDRPGGGKMSSADRCREDKHAFDGSISYGG